MKTKSFLYHLPPALKMATASLTIFILLVTPSLLPAAPKMLMFHPTRLIFTERQRAINVNIINRYNDSITYSISLVNYEKGADGKYHEVISKKGELTRKMIRFSPRRATIAPHERQVVKLMVRKPKDLPPGEYRTYLNLKPHSSPNIGNSPSYNRINGNQIALDVLVSSSLPIIIQHDIPMGDVTPKSLYIKDNLTDTSKITIDVLLGRNGMGSAFGDLILEFLPDKGHGEKMTIGKVQGMAFYAPDSEKIQPVPLTSNLTHEQLKQGTINVSFLPRTRVQDRRGNQRQGEKISKEFDL